MVILIEGPDRVGKSTQLDLIKKYLEENGQTIHVLHYSSIKGDNVKEKSERHYTEMFNLIKFATYNNLNLAMDRAHGGETVYSSIYRNYIGDYVYEIEERFGRRVLNNIKLYVFVADPQDLISRDDGKSFSVELEKKTDEINRFKEFYEKSNIKHKTLINITGKTIEQVFDEVKHHLHANKFL